MRSRRRHREEHENHERWLVSYADFITLLFAFFVVMYAVSSVNEGKMRVLSDSLVATFSSRQKSLSPIQVGELVRSRYTDDVSAITKPLVPPPAINALLKPKPADSSNSPETKGDDTQSKSNPGQGKADGFGGQSGSTMAGVEEIAQRVEDNLSELIDDELVNVRRKEDWLEIEFNSNFLFGSGNAKVSHDATDMLADLSALFVQFPNPIQVEGFTDNVPIHTRQFPSNWELSAARAASVVSVFADLGVKAERLAAIGYGEHRPTADNTTAQGRSKNRRVVLVIPTKPDDRHLAHLQTSLDSMSPTDGETAALAEVDDDGDVFETEQPWAEAPADYDYTRE